MRGPENPPPAPKLIVETADRQVGYEPDGRRRSYILRHWRGDLSLPVSYWLNSFVGTIGVSIVLACTGSLAQPTENLILFAAVASLTSLFAMAVNVWQLVGVWRSAGKHKGRGDSGFWAGVACFMVIAGFLGLARAAVETMFPQLQEVWRIATGDSDIGQHQFHILRAGTELEYAGGITFGVTNEMQKLLDADAVIRVVHLNSRGGRVAEARKLRDLIRERRLITYTASVCASACTIAFMGGVQRYIAPDARLGFHQGSFPGLTDEQLADEEATDRDWLIAAGVPAWFVERAFSTPSSSMWWPKPEELAHAGIITGIAHSDDFAVSGMPAAATQEGVDKELQRNPLYVAIKRFDLETYHKILGIMVDAIRFGRSQAELAAIARPYIDNLYKKYVPVASNDAVTAMAQLVVIETEAIGSKSADACYEFLYPRPGRNTFVATDYLPREIQERDFSTIATVIETGSVSPQRIPTEEEISPLLKIVIDRLAKRYPINDIAALADPGSPTVGHEKVCSMTTALYRDVLTLPAKDKVLLLRFLFAQ